MQNRSALVRTALIVPALLASGLLTSCGSDSSDASDAPTGPTTTCSYPAGGTAAKPVDAPPTTASAAGTVPVTMHTSVGDLKLTLDAAKAPCTVNSFTSLAKQGYFDNTSCHRLTTAASGIEVLQCGDPTGTGSGGPGYTFADELTGHDTYVAGTLAMANGGPDTNGSQFFFVYGDATYLDQHPNYTVFGTFDDATIQTLKGVAAQGTAEGASDGHPKEPVTITSVDLG